MRSLSEDKIEYGKLTFDTSFQDEDEQSYNIEISCEWNERWDFYTGWTKFIDNYSYKIFGSPYTIDAYVNDMVRQTIVFTLSGSVVFEVKEPIIRK